MAIWQLEPMCQMDVTFSSFYELDRKVGQSPLQLKPFTVFTITIFSEIFLKKIYRNLSETHLIYNSALTGLPWITFMSVGSSESLRKPMVMSVIAGIFPFTPYMDSTKPLVRGSRWCFNSGRPFFRAISLLKCILASVNLVPSQNRSN